MMPKIKLAAPIDPELGGVGYFEYLLDSIDRKKLLSEFFEFLEMKILEVSTFTSDFAIRFGNASMEVVVYNDDVGCSELGTTPEATIFFDVTAVSELEIEKFHRRIDKRIRVVKVVPTQP